MPEFAREVGIRQPQHLSEMVRGVGGRRSCCGWRGALLTSRGMAPAPRGNKRPRTPHQTVEEYFVVPERADRIWNDALLSPALVQAGLLPVGCPARERFNTLVVQCPTLGGVPLSQLFPDATVVQCGPSSCTLSLLPNCGAGQFARDVGIRHPQHLGEMIRGSGGRRSCCGWTGGVKMPGMPIVQALEQPMQAASLLESLARKVPMVVAAPMPTPSILASK